MILDERQIEGEHNQVIKASKTATTNLNFVALCVDTLQVLVRQPLEGWDDVAFLRLAIRLLNSAGAAGRCASCGYWQPAAASVRDIVEIFMLLELFRIDRSKLGEWREADDRTLKNRFSARGIREQLTEIGQAPTTDTKEAYEYFSQHGTHPRPDRIVLISRNANTIIGPFPDPLRLLAILFDITRWLGLATANAAVMSDPMRLVSDAEKRAVLAAKMKFSPAFLEWRRWDHGEAYTELKIELDSWLPSTTAHTESN